MNRQLKDNIHHGITDRALGCSGMNDLLQIDADVWNIRVKYYKGNSHDFTCFSSRFPDDRWLDGGRRHLRFFRFLDGEKLRSQIGRAHV